MELIIGRFFLICDIVVYALFFFLMAAPVAYGSFQTSNPIRAVAAGLYHSHSNTRSKPYLWPMLQVAATPDP